MKNERKGPEETLALFFLKGDESNELRKTSGDRMHTGLYLGKFI